MFRVSVAGRIAMLVLLAAATLPAVVRADRPSLALVDADARAAGNRLPEARAVARVLLGRVLPAQLLKLRIDGYGKHEVAGLVLSGVKFHGSLDRAGFDAEAAELARETFAHSAVEEVDIACIVPIAVPKGTIVSGDLAKPTSRTVFTVTVLRSEMPGLEARLRSGDGVYRDPAWLIPRK